MPIRQLSALLVNQIAAGEVIERPASVVKELVENSLDAGARRIEVRIEEGGRELIRVADDGCGIPADELPLALSPHATSKITQASDLEAIGTMGFRGEALASIASISRLRLGSRTTGAQAGALIEGSGDQIEPVRPEGCAPGTVVEIRNLFFNTPARRKFMRAASTEFGHISDMLTRLAMAHPAVGFKLSHDDRKTLDLPPSQAPVQRCLALLGNDLAEGLLEFSAEDRGMKLWGLAGMPSLAKATAKHQYVYVNHRPVRDRNIQHAIKEAYRGLIEPNLQPMVVLFLSMPAENVDVNVHPTKAEVRFADANAVHGAVLGTIRRRLLETDLTPRVFNSGVPLPPPAIYPEQLNLNASGATPAQTTQAFVDYFRRMDPQQKHMVYEQVRKEIVPSEDEGAALTAPIRPASQSILQVHNSYIVTQDEQGIVIIDQHALHERMMFQVLLDRIASAGALESQRLLTPATLNATASRINTLSRLHPLLEKIGMEAAPIGPASIAIHAFPTLLFDRHVDPIEFLDQLLDKAEEEGMNPSGEAALHEVLDMMSCKAAIKAGDRLQPDELGELLTRKDQIERSSSCPHGRPTTIRLTLRDLEKHFKRT